MQKILWILLLYLISLPAYSTVCTDYLAGNYNPPAVITSQKEYIDKYEDFQEFSHSVKNYFDKDIYI